MTVLSAYANGFPFILSLNFYKLTTISFFVSMHWDGSAYACVRLAWQLVGSYSCVDCHQKHLTRVHVETACYIGLSLHCFKEVLCAVFWTFSVSLEGKTKINSGVELFCKTAARLCRGTASAVVVIIIIIIELN
jgi:hypothetical protein